MLGMGVQMNIKVSHFASKSLIFWKKKPPKHMPFKNIA